MRRKFRYFEHRKFRYFEHRRAEHSLGTVFTKALAAASESNEFTSSA
jgi:hypothetical protein